MNEIYVKIDLTHMETLWLELSLEARIKDRKNAIELYKKWDMEECIPQVQDEINQMESVLEKIKEAAKPILGGKK